MKYSAGVLPEKIRRPMSNISMVKLRGLMIKFDKYRAKISNLIARDQPFATREEVQWLFGLNSMQTFELFRLMDKEHMFRISLLDLWGSLVLLTLDLSPDDKVEQCWYLANKSNSGWLPLHDFKALMTCVMRGLSRLKNIHVFPETSVGKFIKSMLSFAMPNEKGEISLRDVRGYMSMDENCRSYFSALGAKAAIIDTGMLVAQRREIMQGIAEVEKDIQELMYKERLTQEDVDAYNKERGGDANVLRLGAAKSDAATENTKTAKALVANNNQKEVVEEEVKVEEDLDWGEPTLEQRARRLQRSKARGAAQGSALRDALVFSDPNYHKKNKSGGSASFDEQSIMRKWNGMTYENIDRLQVLDVDLVEDLFESAGITLTDETVDEYLSIVPANQLNMRDLASMLTWYRDRMNTSAPIKGRPPLWRRTAVDIFENVRFNIGKISEFINVLTRQKEVVDNIKAKVMMIANRMQEDKDKEEEERLKNEPVDKRMPGKPKSPKKTKTSVMSQKDVAGEMKGAIRFAAWHRNQLMKPNPNRIEVHFQFGYPEEAAEKIAAEKEAIAKAKADAEKASGGGGGPDVMERLKTQLANKGKPVAKAPSTSQGPEYKTHLKLAYHLLAVPKGERPLFYEEKGAWQVLKKAQAKSYTSLELLDVFKMESKAKVRSIVEEAVADKKVKGEEVTAGSVGWISLSIGDGVTEKEEHILCKSITNFFNSIPLEYRCGIYTQVNCKVFVLPADGEESESSDDEEEEDDDDDEGEGEGGEKTAESVKSSKKATNNKAPDKGVGSLLADTKRSKRKRVLIVTLLHEVDRFEQFEESLPAGVLLSRTVHRAAVDLQIMNKWDDLYKQSVSYENFEHRLFGPQEDELGDDGMNPIRFAKMQKQRVNALKDMIKKVNNMSPELVEKQLLMRGLSVLGDNREKKRRYKKALEAQLQISGFGELSAFGADMAKKIFKHFRRNRNDGDKMTAHKIKMEEQAKENAGPAKKKMFGNKSSKSKGKDAEKEAKEAEEAAKMSEEEQNIHGMNLWDFNNFMSTTQGQTLYDYKEYELAFREYGLLVDKRMGLVPEGLNAYYEKYGGLANDIRRIGLGSLNDELKGELKASVQYDGEGLDSVRSLLEGHSVMYPWLKVFVTSFAGMTKYMHEAEFENVAEMLNFANNELFAELRNNLKTPGWFSSVIHNLIEYLADGPDGLLVSTRRGVHENYGRFSSWDHVFSEMLGDLDMNNIDDDDNNDDDNNDDQGNKNKDGEEKDPNDVLKEKAFELFDHRVTDLLPPESDGSAENISSKKLHKLVYLNKRLDEILSDYDTFPLTREERESLVDMRSKTTAEITFSKDKIEESKQLCCAHALSAYDAIRLYTDSITSFGWGTREVSAHFHAEGLNVIKHLPMGMGEVSKPKQDQIDKLDRVAKRRAAAIAAIEREKLRRDVGGEGEAAKRKAEKAAAVAKKRLEEENNLFVEAKEGLYAVRLGGKSTADVQKISRIWEKLASAGTQRYANTLRMAIFSANCGYAKNDMYGVDHVQGKDAIRKLDEAHQCVMKLLEGYSNLDYSEDPNPINRKKNAAKRVEQEEKKHISAIKMPPKEGSEEGRIITSEQEGESGEDSSVKDVIDDSAAVIQEVMKVPENEIPFFFVILQNFVTVLRKAGNNFMLGKLDRARKCINALYDVIDDGDRDAIIMHNNPVEMTNSETEISLFVVEDTEDMVEQTRGEVKALYGEHEYSDTDTGSDEEEEEYDGTIVGDEEDGSIKSGLSSLTSGKRSIKSKKSAGGNKPGLADGGSVSSIGEGTASIVSGNAHDADDPRAPQATRFKRRSSVAVGMAAGKLGAAITLTKEDEEAQKQEEAAEAARRDQQRKRKEKLERQRRVDAALRKRVIKQRNKLYHLIESDKISAIFEQKAQGHVLGEGGGLKGFSNSEDVHEAQDRDALDFLDDSTVATSSSEEDSEDERERRRAETKKKKKEKKEREKDGFDDLSTYADNSVTGLGLGGGSVSTYADNSVTGLGLGGGSVATLSTSALDDGSSQMTMSTSLEVFSKGNYGDMGSLTTVQQNDDASIATAPSLMTLQEEGQLESLGSKKEEKRKKGFFSSLFGSK